MTIRSKIVLCLVLIVFALSFKEFMPEIFALGWHVRHGRELPLKTFDGKTYVLDVPILFWPQVDDLSRDVTVIKTPGPLQGWRHQSDWATMSFSVAGQYTTGEELQSGATALQANAGLVFTDLATVGVAGQDLHCFGHNWAKGKLAELSRRTPTVEIECVPLSDKHSFSASYMGSRALLPAFYDVLRTVKRVN